MKHILIGTLILMLLACSGTEQTAEITKLESRQDSISYSIGMDIGGTLNMQFIEVDPAVLYQGFKDGYGEGSELIPMDQRQAILMAYQQELRVVQAEKRQEMTAKNLMEANDFLNENSGNDGVIVLPSGLQYKVLVTGDGPVPTSQDRVKVHYAGKLLDGTEFDSSHRRGQPATFGVTGVIKGWVEALQLMQVGSKWELYIPPALGYGERGSQNIPPNSALIFEVELLEIVN